MRNVVCPVCHSTVAPREMCFTCEQSPQQPSVERGAEVARLMFERMAERQATNAERDRAARAAMADFEARTGHPF